MAPRKMEMVTRHSLLSPNHSSVADRSPLYSEESGSNITAYRAAR